jgi:type IV secretion system protein TrbI
MIRQSDPMSPEVSPTSIGRKGGVRRVNNVPVYILGATVGTFLLIMMLVAADRASKQNGQTSAPPERAGSASMFAKEVVGDIDTGIVPPRTVPEPPANLDSPPIPIARPALETPPPLPAPPERDDEAERIRMAKFQVFQEAIKAKTTVRVELHNAKGSISLPSGEPQSREEMLARLAAVRQQIGAQSTATDPSSAYQSRLAQIRGSGAVLQNVGRSSSGSSSSLLGSSTSQRNSLAQFSSNNETDRWKLESQIDTPQSPYQLRAGFVMPATLISGVNSEIPGQIIAQVSHGVYDTPTGKHLLIPQGARLVGAYSSDVAFGQKRAFVAWQRIIFPDGKALDIGSMPGADSAGYSGFHDSVNNHYFRVFGSAFLMSGVVAAVSLSQDNGTTGNRDQRRASDALSESLGQVFGTTIAQLISKNLNIAPTLEIRPGYRFNVIVTKDITFLKPYVSFDY